MKTLVALPVFNEAKHVTAVLDEVLRYAEDVLVVDDGSTDGTSQLLSARNDVAVLPFALNRGYGAALQAAFRYASLHDYDYIWDFVDGEPVQNRFKKVSHIPSTSCESDALSKDLKKRGFRFVGSTIMYAHMQATGLVNDHVVGCFRHKYCATLAKTS